MLSDWFGPADDSTDSEYPGDSAPSTQSAPKPPVLRPDKLTAGNADSFARRLRSNLRDCLAGQSFRDFLMGRKRQPAGPSAIWARDAWQRDPQFARVEALSIAIHVTILALLIMPLLPRVVAPNLNQKPPYTLIPGDGLAKLLRQLRPPQTALVPQRPRGGGGGGDHDSRPESVGMVPLFNRIPLVPPAVKTRRNPEYPVQPKILGPEDMKILSPEMSNWGNPVSRLLTDSNGPGTEHGIGNGRGKGVGPGDGDGYGNGHDWGVGGEYPISGANGYREVACVYCPAAQFSDEAVKAKFEGTVLISLVVTPDGRAMDVRVVRGLGMGLDEQAEAAVRKWRFTPSVGPDGKVASVRALVEVVFHLY